MIQSSRVVAFGETVLLTIRVRRAVALTARATDLFAKRKIVMPRDDCACAAADVVVHHRACRSLHVLQHVLQAATTAAWIARYRTDLPLWAKVAYDRARRSSN